MISTVLANLGRWSDLILAVVAAGFIVGGLLLALRGARGRAAAIGLGLVMTAVALAFALTPESGDDARRAFCFVGDAVPRLGDTANVAMLFPAAFLLTIGTRAPLPVMAATSGLSAAIETVQGAATALNRSCDLNDWYANTAGAVLGALLGGLAVVTVRRTAARRTTDRVPARS